MMCSVGFGAAMERGRARLSAQGPGPSVDPRQAPLFEAVRLAHEDHSAEKNGPGASRARYQQGAVADLRKQAPDAVDLLKRPPVAWVPVCRFCCGRNSEPALSICVVFTMAGTWGQASLRDRRLGRRRALILLLQAHSTRNTVNASPHHVQTLPSQSLPS